MSCGRWLFIACEGLDGAGKTTTIKEMLKICSEGFFYSKGIGSDTIIGKISRKLPSTFMFMLELIYIMLKYIKPNLRRGNIVIQDRYDISILSHIPKVKRWYNQVLIKLIKPFLITPDALVYFYVSLAGRIRRLKKSRHNKYHKILLMEHKLINAREREYLKLYNSFAGEKIKIDTTNKTAKESAEMLRKFVFKIQRASSL